MKLSWKIFFITTPIFSPVSYGVRMLDGRSEFSEQSEAAGGTLPDGKPDVSEFL